MAAGLLVSDEIYYVLRICSEGRKVQKWLPVEKPVDKKAQICWSQQKKFSNSVITRVLSRKAAQTHKPCWFPSLSARNRNKIVLWSVEEVVFLLRLLKGNQMHESLEPTRPVSTIRTDAVGVSTTSSVFCSHVCRGL